MRFDEIVESIIKDAIEHGEFDNLSNKGKRIDLSAYFDTPEETRLANSILKNAGILPAEVELRKEIDALKEKLASCTDQEESYRLKKQIEQRRLNYNIQLERQKLLGRKK